MNRLKDSSTTMLRLEWLNIDKVLHYAACFTSHRLVSTQMEPEVYQNINKYLVHKQ